MCILSNINKSWQSNWIGESPTSLFDVTALDVGERDGRFGRIILSVAGVTLNDRTKYLITRKGYHSLLTEYVK